jgi:hypothetical protein
MAEGKQMIEDIQPEVPSLRHIISAQEELVERNSGDS